MTEWRSVVGFEGRYAVSDAGEFMSMDFKGSGLPGLMKTGCNPGGYRQINLIVSRGTVKRFLAHRLVAEAFLGECPTGWQVNHKNGNKADNLVSNLEYCTPSQNKKHSVIAGLCTFRLGQEHQNAKLTSDDVLAIRKLLALGLTQSEIAKSYGVVSGTIGSISRGQTWSHLAAKKEESMKNIQVQHVAAAEGERL